MAGGGTRFLDDILSVLIPGSCPLCRKSALKRGEPFCRSCVSSFHLFAPSLCSCCGIPLPSRPDEPALLCTACLCRPRLPFPSVTVRSLGPYSGGLREALLKLKYGRQILLAPALGLLLVLHLSRLFPSRTFDAVLPVPLHPRRLREREFNQSVLIARPLAEFLDVPLDLRSAERVRNTPSQSLFKGPERRRNLQGAFGVRDGHSLRNKSILILDDVYTTGATVETLAALFFSAGAARVSVLTAARSLESGLSCPSPSPRAEQEADGAGLDTRGPLD